MKKNTNVLVSMPKELKEKIVKFIEKNDKITSMNSLIRIAIIDFLDRND